VIGTLYVKVLISRCGWLFWPYDLFGIPSLSGSSEPFAVSFWTTLYSGMPTTWRKSLRASKCITTIIARTAHSAVIHRRKWLEAFQNCKQSWNTSVGRRTAVGSISFPQRLEYQFVYGQATIFCRIRSYLSTCRKQGMTATQALTLLFQGKNPDFMKTDEA